MQTWPHVVDLEIPEVDSKDVTILLGTNVLEAILQHEVRRGSPGQPAAVLTAFGWTITGSVESLCIFLSWTMIPHKTAELLAKLWKKLKQNCTKFLPNHLTLT